MTVTVTVHVGQVAKVFRLVNLDRKLLGHALSDIHELQFSEFLVFMSRLEQSYTDRVLAQMEVFTRHLNSKLEALMWTPLK